MTSRADLERHLYTAITGNRLSARTHTLDNAIKELGNRTKQPWAVVGVSRETWRRWRKGIQKPGKSAQAGLLAVLRRLRLSDSRESRMRASQGIHVRAWDNYEDQERNLGKSTFDMTAPRTNDLISDILNAYMIRGVEAAADKWLAAFPKDGGWAQEWLHPDSDGSSQSMDITSVSLMGDPARAGRGRRR